MAANKLRMDATPRRPNTARRKYMEGLARTAWDLYDYHSDGFGFQRGIAVCTARPASSGYCIVFSVGRKKKQSPHLASVPCARNYVQVSASAESERAADE